MPDYGICSLKLKIILLAIIPLVVVITVISLMFFLGSIDLAKEQRRIIKENIMAEKKYELQSYVNIAMYSINHIINVNEDKEEAKEHVKALLNNMRFDSDGYFFVYTMDGTNILHPMLPEIQGKNVWHVKDKNGKQVIKELTAIAKNGGGFFQYCWNKPSVNKDMPKIGYVVSLPEWGWMVGSGIYIDDIDEEIKDFNDQVTNSFNNTFVRVMIVTIISISMIILFILSINISEKKLADKKLKELTQRIVDLQEAERARVARELHDGINQLLVCIKYSLEAAKEHVNKKSAAEQELQCGIQRLDEAIQEIRRISRDLRPSLLDHLGLFPALEALCRDFSRRTNIDVRYIAVDNLRLASEVETTLYRIAQEALTNVERHANATQVRLWFKVNKLALMMYIEDNGQGILSSHQSNGTAITDVCRGVGLRNMRERIGYHGGEMLIDTKTHNGTKITIKLPLLSIQEAA
ncbi:cache domain-containing protein [Zooshikella marina]|uniref:cache domain-containing protein n=1 Tax=Zooshikella ganghwensis TaxID=202772 RepID=UPI001BAE94E1|nr:cache domain-containing protein [Zooshikella ganghwensis]MBU2707175.1 cache domain-containing protein [Zooshikella ganghwensis]